MRTPKHLRQLFNSTSGHENARRYLCSPCIWEHAVPSRGKVNVYTCKKGHQTWTIHADDGVTPYNICCHRCGGDAYSAVYHCDQHPLQIHGVWSKEPNSWWGDKSAQDKHALNGGVFLYAIQQERGELE